MEEKNNIVNLHERLIQKFIEKRRPSPEIRDELDLPYTFENDILEIFQIRSLWNDSSKKITIPVAKSKYIKSRKIWKIFWQRANGKWKAYKPNEEVKDITEFFKILEEDELGCFWG